MVEVVAAPPLPQPMSRDRDDDRVLAAAVAGKADMIVSGDDDLLWLGSYDGIRILTPAEALRALGIG
jgi:predicted nucleic acid-binding protein